MKKRNKKVRVEPRGQEWVTIDPNCEEEYRVSDPYESEAAATEDAKGLNKFYKVKI